MKDIAHETGVSITTVSHVINKTRHVNSETRQLVLEAMNRLEYDHKRSRKKNGRTKSGLIGVIIADIREDYYVSVVKAIETVASENDLSIVFCDSEMDYEKENHNIQTILEKDTAGIIIAPISSEHFPASLKTSELPVVLIDRQYDQHDRTFVGINNFESGYQAEKHLEKKGCRHIGFIGYAEHVYTIEKRIQGYKSALQELNKPAPPVLFIRYDKEDSFSLIKDYIIRNAFDGLICATSDICYEAVSVIDELDVNIPDEMKIITYDDNKWLDYLKYPISVVSQPTAEIGEYAVEKVLHQLNNPAENRHVKSEVLFDIDIIDR